MYELAPGYLVELSRQMGFLAAFLGGFAGILLQLMLQTKEPPKLVATAIGFTVAAAVAFIVTLTASTMIGAVLHPDAPSYVADSPGLGRARAVLTLSFMLGLYALLVSLGLSGWMRSRPSGLTTSIVAGIGFLLVTWGWRGSETAAVATSSDRMRSSSTPPPLRGPPPHRCATGRKGVSMRGFRPGVLPDGRP